MKLQDKCLFSFFTAAKPLRRSVGRRIIKSGNSVFQILDRAEMCVIAAGAEGICRICEAAPEMFDVSEIKADCFQLHCAE